MKSFSCPLLRSFHSRCLFALIAAILGVAILPPATAHATIGDTRAQIRGKYGAGRTVNPGVVYGLDDDAYSLTIYFLGDTSVLEIYSKAKSRSGVAYPLNGPEIIRFLQANGNGYAWKPFVPKTKKPRVGMHFWYRTDGKVLAQFNTKDGNLLFRPWAD